MIHEQILFKRASLIDDLNDHAAAGWEFVCWKDERWNVAETRADDTRIGVLRKAPPTSGDSNG